MGRLVRWRSRMLNIWKFSELINWSNDIFMYFISNFTVLLRSFLDRDSHAADSIFSCIASIALIALSSIHFVIFAVAINKHTNTIIPNIITVCTAITYSLIIFFSTKWIEGSTSAISKFVARVAISAWSIFIFPLETLIINLLAGVTAQVEPKRAFYTPSIFVVPCTVRDIEFRTNWLFDDCLFITVFSSEIGHHIDTLASDQIVPLEAIFASAILHIPFLAIGTYCCADFLGVEDESVSTNDANIILEFEAVGFQAILNAGVIEGEVAWPAGCAMTLLIGLSA